MNKLPKIQVFFFRLAVVLAFGLVIFCALRLPKLYEDYVFEDRTLNVYTFAEMIPSDTVRAFEQRYKVKVNLRYFEHNEDLLAKFKITRGLGYDVVTASDFAVDLLKNDGLLHRLDYQQLSEAIHLNKRLLGHDFDHNNEYSLPIGWVPYGIVFHKNLFVSLPDEISLKVLFEDPSLSGLATRPYRICMPDDYREAILIAALYTTGKVMYFSDEELLKIQAVLIRQKSHVESYLNRDLQYFFLANIVQLAFCSSAYVKKLLHSSDEFVFKIPIEGSLFSIENIAITASSKKVDLAHQFINFILSPENGVLMHQLYGYNPANNNAYAHIDEKFLKNLDLFPNDQVFSRLHLIHNVIQLKKFEEVWLHVKAS